MCVWGCFRQPLFWNISSLTHLFSLQILLPLTSWQRLSRTQHREQSFISSQGSNSQLWTPWHDVKTDPGNLIKDLNLNPRLKLAPSYTICLFHFTIHKEPRTYLSCPSQCFFPPVQALLARSLSLPSASFLWWGWCFCGQNSWRACILGGYGEMGWEKEKSY